jgi:1-acyl-sn-glycerol-3-phosphate acyltransferase
MGNLVQGLRSVLFIVQMYLAMPVIAIALFPMALFSSRWAYIACHSYARWVIWTASWMVGLRTEIRGTPPVTPALIAAKHQSFFDILVIFSAMPRGRFIMKREVMWMPFIGQYGMRIGCIAVNRGKRGAAIKKMVADVLAGRDAGGQLIIFAQGTRVAPGAMLPYKIGTGVLYREMGQDCVPVATNIGVFWPKRSLMRKPGLAVVEFLPAIAPGMPVDAFMARIEAEIEGHSNRLMADAGFTLPEGAPRLP